MEKNERKKNMKRDKKNKSKDRQTTKRKKKVHSNNGKNVK